MEPLFYNFIKFLRILKNFQEHFFYRRPSLADSASSSSPFKPQPRKMVKHTQTIRRLPTDCLSVFDHFVGLALEG